MWRLTPSVARDGLLELLVSLLRVAADARCCQGWVPGVAVVGVVVVVVVVVDVVVTLLL